MDGSLYEKISKECKKLGLTVGYAQIMINRKFNYLGQVGFCFIDLPDDATGPVLQFLRENAYRNIEIVNYDLHLKLYKNLENYKLAYDNKQIYH